MSYNFDTDSSGNSSDDQVFVGSQGLTRRKTEKCKRKGTNSTRLSQSVCLAETVPSQEGPSPLRACSTLEKIEVLNSSSLCVTDSEDDFEVWTQTFPAFSTPKSSQTGVFSQKSMDRGKQRKDTGSRGNRNVAITVSSSNRVSDSDSSSDLEETLYTKARHPLKVKHSDGAKSSNTLGFQSNLNQTKQTRMQKNKAKCVKEDRDMSGKKTTNKKGAPNKTKRLLTLKSSQKEVKSTSTLKNVRVNVRCLESPLQSLGATAVSETESDDCADSLSQKQRKSNSADKNTISEPDMDSDYETVPISPSMRPSVNDNTSEKTMKELSIKEVKSTLYSGQKSQSGSGDSLKSEDIKTPSPSVMLGKEHPSVKVMRKTKRKGGKVGTQADACVSDNVRKMEMGVDRQETNQILSMKKSQKHVREKISAPDWEKVQSSKFELDDFSPWLSTQPEKRLNAPNLRIVPKPKDDVKDVISETDDDSLSDCLESSLSANGKTSQKAVILQRKPSEHELPNMPSVDKLDIISDPVSAKRWSQPNDLLPLNSSMERESSSTPTVKHLSLHGITNQGKARLSFLFKKVQNSQTTVTTDSPPEIVKDGMVNDQAKTSPEDSSEMMSHLKQTRKILPTGKHSSLQGITTQSKGKLSFLLKKVHELQNTSTTDGPAEISKNETVNEQDETSPNDSSEMHMGRKMSEMMSRLKQRKSFISSLLANALKKTTVDSLPSNDDCVCLDDNESTNQTQQSLSKPEKKQKRQGEQEEEPTAEDGGGIWEGETQEYPLHQSELSQDSDMTVVPSGADNSQISQDPDVTVLLSGADNSQKSQDLDVTVLPSGVDSSQISQDSDVTVFPSGADNSQKSQDSDVTVLLSGADNSQKSQDSDVTALLYGTDNSEKSQDSDVAVFLSGADNSQKSQDSDVIVLLSGADNSQKSQDSDVTVLPSGADNSQKSQDSDVTVLLSDKDGSQKKTAARDEKCESPSSSLWGSLESEHTLEYHFPSLSKNGEKNEVVPSSMNTGECSNSSLQEKYLLHIANGSENSHSSEASEIVSFQDMRDDPAWEADNVSGSVESPQRDLFLRTSSMPILSLCPSTLSQNDSVEEENCTQMIPQLTLEKEVSLPPLTLEKEVSLPPLTLEKEVSLPPLTLEKEVSLPPLTLEKEGSLPPLTLEKKGSFPPLTLEKEGSVSQLTLEKKGNVPQLTLEKNGSVSQLTSERSTREKHANSPPCNTWAENCKDSANFSSYSSQQQKNSDCEAVVISSCTSPQKATQKLSFCIKAGTSKHGKEAMEESDSDSSYVRPRNAEAPMFSQDSASDSDCLREDIRCVLQKLERADTLPLERDASSNVMQIAPIQSTGGTNESGSEECVEKANDDLKKGACSDSSFYETEDASVYVFESDDEELFSTQSMYGADLVVQEVCDSEEISDEYYRRTQDDSLWWDNTSDDYDNENDRSNDLSPETSLSPEASLTNTNDQINDDEDDTHVSAVSIIDEEKSPGTESDSPGYTLQTRYFNVRLLEDETHLSQKHVISSTPLTKGKEEILPIMPELSSVCSENIESVSESSKMSVDDTAKISVDDAAKMSLDDAAKINVDDAAKLSIADANSDGVNAFDLDTQIDASSDVGTDDDADPYLTATQAVVDRTDLEDHDSDFDENDYLAQTQVDYLMISSDEDEDNDQEGEALVYSNGTSLDNSDTEKGHLCKRNERSSSPVSLFPRANKKLEQKNLAIGIILDKEIKVEKDVEKDVELNDDYVHHTSPNPYLLETLEDDVNNPDLTSEAAFDPYSLSTQVDEPSPSSSPLHHHFQQNVEMESTDRKIAKSVIQEEQEDESSLIELDDSSTYYGMDTQVDLVEETGISTSPNSGFSIVDPFELQTQPGFSPQHEDESSSTEYEERNVGDKNKTTVSQNQLHEEFPATPPKKLRLSTDDGVSENNIVEYISSTQVDLPTVDHGRSKKIPSLPRKRSSENKPVAISEGIFERISKEQTEPLLPDRAVSTSFTTANHCALKRQKIDNEAHENEFAITETSTKYIDISEVSEDVQNSENGEDEEEMDEIYLMSTQVDSFGEGDEARDVPVDLFSMATLVEDNEDEYLISPDPDDCQGTDSTKKTSGQPESSYDANVQSEDRTKSSIKPVGKNEMPVTSESKMEVETEKDSHVDRGNSKFHVEGRKCSEGRGNMPGDVEVTLEYDFEDNDEIGDAIDDLRHASVKDNEHDHGNVPRAALTNIPSKNVADGTSRSAGLSPDAAALEKKHVGSREVVEQQRVRQESASSEVKDLQTSLRKSVEREQIERKRTAVDHRSSPKELVRKVVLADGKSSKKVLVDDHTDGHVNNNIHKRSETTESVGVGDKVQERWLSSSSPKKLSKNNKALKASNRNTSPTKGHSRKLPLTSSKRQHQESISSLDEQIKKVKITAQKRILDGAVTGASGVSHWRKDKMTFCNDQRATEEKTSEHRYPGRGQTISSIIPASSNSGKTTMLPLAERENNGEKETLSGTQNSELSSPSNARLVRDSTEVRFIKLCDKIKSNHAKPGSKREVKEIVLEKRKSVTHQMPENRKADEKRGENSSAVKFVPGPLQGQPHAKHSTTFAVDPSRKSHVSSVTKPVGILKDRNSPASNHARTPGKVQFDASRNEIAYVAARPALLQPPPIFSLQPNPKLRVENYPTFSFTPFLNETDFIFKLMSWNPSWLSEQAKQHKPPPVLGGKHTFSQLRTSYDDFGSYQKTSFELLLLEIWAMLHTEWKKRCQGEMLPALISGRHNNEEEQKLGILSFDLKVIVCPSEKQQIPAIGDMVILNMSGSFKANLDVKQSYSQFGFVKEVMEEFNKARNRDLFNKVKENLPGHIDRGARVFRVKICIRYKTFVPFDFLKVQRVTSLTTSLRQFQALVNLPKNPVSKALLNPHGEDPVFCIENSVGDSELKTLNKEQAEAVTAIRKAVLEDPRQPKVCLLQGPPGTGKSHTILVLVHQILIRSRFKARICLAAPSNAAVDEIAQRIITFSQKQCSSQNIHGINVLRVGMLDRVSDAVKSNHLENKSKERYVQYQLDKCPTLREEIKMVNGRINTLKASLRNRDVGDAQKVSSVEELNRLEQDLRKLESEARNIPLTNSEKRKVDDGIVEESHVICSTLSSFGSGYIQPLLRYRFGTNVRREPFNCLIVDEATQAIEMEALIPLQYLMAKVVLVGDQKQLPPTVNSKEARDNRFDRSLFERLHSKFSHSPNKNPIMTLKQQYRMHPEILDLPNSYFYNDQLYTAESVLNSRRSNLSPYLVFDVQDGQEIQNKIGSYSNRLEAAFIAKLCHQVVRVLSANNKHNVRMGAGNHIGIICPYAAQKQKIQESLRSRGLEEIEVSTVDSFQGQERDVIILSCVRAQSNPQTIGFVGDVKRMNVALTRAKLALYIVGHFNTLSVSDLWRLLHLNAEKRQRLIPVSGWDGSSQEPFRVVDTRDASKHRK